jgi:integrase
MRGNITRRGKSSWRIKFDVGADATGKRCIRYVTVKGKRADAEAELARLLNDAHRGTLVDPSKITVADWLRQWLDAAKPDLAGTTVQNYSDKIERQIIPVIGEIELQKLKPAHVSRWLNNMPSTRPLSARSRMQTFKVLRAALTEAVRLEVIYRNVGDAVKPLEVKAPRVLPLTEDQLSQLSKLEGHWLHPIANLALASGARRGELLALRWSDLDFDKSTMRIERSLEETKAGGLRFKAPKTEYSVRALSLPPSAVAMLVQHRKSQLELRFKLGMGKPTAETLVFCDHNGEAIQPDNLSKAWQRLTKARSMPRVHFHALRHTHASMLIAAGVDIVQISRRLGHASPTITLGVYAHLFKKGDENVVAAIEAALGKI